MCGIYQKTINITHVVDYIRCDKCGVESPFSVAIDSWCIIDGKNYCMKCQKEHGVGLYEK